ncbi:hypothetical protein JAB4_059260 (plasmid) [Janthinobacterium sp. HH102]|uniref:hypothetical protein n=1 Tax=Janthinobacterium sp. HH102 TaxID=1537274 RepID=UPI000892CEE5|nr:hypothetical protein [Janthinobacterium sp. HH102]QOU76426.1 hypothetical protein JAB4_059260 [Janthinobacterium sp. HH102]
MRKFVEIIIFIISLFLLPSAFAQGWKPLCVNDTDKAGKNNGTWQKLNTPSSGGNTWKKVGDCIIPDPPINGGRPYTHIIDTGASMGNNHCNALGGFTGNGDTIYTKWDPRLLTGKLTPNTIDGVAVTRLDDNCGQGLTVAFDSRLGVNGKRQHFKSLTIYDSPLTTTWVWGKAGMDWYQYLCDSPGGEWGPPPTECSTMVVWGPRGMPVRMQPYTRYYINVIY